jgi:hypothetical protein
MALTCGARSRAVVVVALAFTSAVATAGTAGTGGGGGGGPQWIHGATFPGNPDGITICGEFWPLEFRSCAAHHRQCLACCADSKILSM